MRNNNSTIHYRSRGALKLSVYVVARTKGQVQYHYGQDDSPGCAEESQGGIYTVSAKVFDQRYAPAR
jgi:hypothetical protein